MIEPSEPNNRPSDDCPINDIFSRLQKLDDDIASDSNKHERAAALIVACLTENINKPRHIIGVLQHLGFDRAHIAITLDELSGGNAAQAWWWRDAGGEYHLHA